MSDAKLVRESVTPRGANRLERTLRLGSLVERDPPAAGNTPQPVGVAQPVVQQLVRWIPTETITLYVALVAILTYPTAKENEKVCALSFTAQWWAAIAFTLVTVFVVLAIYVTKVRSTSQPFRWPIFEMIAAPVAFAAWAVALPQTPLNDFCGYKAATGGYVVLVTSVAIGLVAGMFGKNPPS